MLSEYSEELPCYMGRALNNATVKYHFFVEDGMSVEQEMTEKSDPYHSNFFHNISVIEINIVSYLTGFVAKKIKERITCETCVGALTSIGSDFYHNNESQINIKSKGYPTGPSNDVSIACMMAEKFKKKFPPILKF